MVTWKKNRTHQFPVLELHLAEWVDQANEKHIQVTDDVLRIATEELISMLPTKLTTPGSGRARQGAGMYGHADGKPTLPVGPSVIANITCMGTGIKKASGPVFGGFVWGVRYSGGILVECARHPIRPVYRGFRYTGVRYSGGRL